MDDALLGFDIDAAIDSRQQQQQQQTQQQQQSPSVGLPAASPTAVVMTAMQVTAPTFVAIPAAKTAQQQQQQQQLVPPTGGMSQDAKARAETNRAAALAKQAIRKKERSYSHTVSAGPGLAHLGAMQPLPTLPQVLPVQYPQPQQPLKPLAPPQQPALPTDAVQLDVHLVPQDQHPNHPHDVPLAKVGGAHDEVVRFDRDLVVVVVVVV